MKLLSRKERVAECVGELTTKPEFPTFSRHVQKILTAVDDQEKSARELTDLIVRDYSLTLRVLRAANSQSYYGRPILSVTRAVMQLGTEAVRHLAGGLLIFEHFHNKPAAVRELMMLSMLTANHVRQIVRIVGVAQPEEAYLCGMTRNLGEVLIAYYLPAEYAQIQLLTEKKRATPSTACLEVMRFSFEDLGSAVARYWGMPDSIADCQQPWAGPRASGPSAAGILHAAVSMGHKLTTAVYRAGTEGQSDRLKACMREHYALLPLSQKDVEGILESAIAETKESFSAMHVGLNELRLRTDTRSALKSLQHGARPDADDPDRLAQETSALLAMMGVQIPGIPGRAESSEPPEEYGPGEDGEDIDLGEGPSEITLERLTKEACSGLDSQTDFDLTTFILSVLEAIYRGIGFDRVLFGFVNPDRTHIEGRLGLGEDIDGLIEKFRFRMSMSGGPVSVALMCKRTVVAEAGDAKSAAIAEVLGSSYSALYPILGLGKVVGCLYMESRDPRPSLTENELARLEQLRDALAAAVERQRRS